MVYFTTIPMLYIQFDIHNNNVHIHMKFEYLVFSEGVFHLLRLHYDIVACFLKLESSIQISFHDDSYIQ